MTDETRNNSRSALEELSSAIQDMTEQAQLLRQKAIFPPPSQQDSFKRRLLYRIMRPFVLKVQQYQDAIDQLANSQISLATTCEKIAVEHNRRLDWTLDELQKTVQIATTHEQVIAEQTHRLGQIVATCEQVIAEHTQRLDWTLDELKQLSAARVEAENTLSLLREHSSQTDEALENLQQEVRKYAQLTAQVPEALNVRLRMVEEQSLTQDDLNKSLQIDLQELNRRLSTLVDKLHNVSSAGMTLQSDTLPDGVPDSEFDFLAWERFTRGSEKGIYKEQETYAQWFADATLPVLDAGCGRGEFLEILRAHNIDAYGIDTDKSMVEHCKLKGLNVLQENLVTHISSLPGDSLGGIFLGHVIEHLPTNVLMALIALLQKKLKSGAAVIMETPNPTCLTMFSGAFYADPTHIRPVHPKTLEFLCAANGFDGMTLILSAPIPKEDALQPLAETEPIRPVEKNLLLQINKNIEHLNSVLFSYGNYAIAARKK
ncbi:MAG: methionine biosynthesis protein MetW [Candidatus Sumerlaeales bacterium]|nr:methionine biosynthesis protein MetW [Candidatus Sumerlaeales bacterium]